MNRILPVTAIPAEFIKTIEEAQGELHHRGWSIGHTAIGSVHKVREHKRKARIVANAKAELDAWLLACVKANVQDRIWRERTNSQKLRNWACCSVVYIC